MTNDVLICVPTCGGPYLNNCIQSLIKSERKDFDVVVVFNGVEDLFDSYRTPEFAEFDLKKHYIQEKGVVHVRNYFINYAFRENNYKYLVMLDDDQMVAANWFSNIYEICKSDSYDIVGSFVRPYFLNANHEVWMDKLNVYYLNHRDTGVVDILHGTGGTVFCNRIVALMHGEMFDPDFAATGGEDADFFIRAKNNGARFYRARYAICFETIDESRGEFEWAKKRYYRIGFCDAKLNEKYKVNPIFYFLAFSSLIVYFFVSVFHLNNTKRKLFSCLLNRQIGKISYLFVRDKNFYKK